MYKIKNISNGKIILGDLNLIINKDQEIDLDTLYSRDRLEQSTALYRCIQPAQKKLIIIHKDMDVSNIDPAVLATLEAKLKEQITEQLTMQPMQTSGDSESISEVKKQLEFLIKYVTTQKTEIKYTNTQEPVKTDETTEYTIDIQEKLIKRLSKNVESKVDTKEEIKESDVNKRANELEGFV